MYFSLFFSETVLCFAALLITGQPHPSHYKVSQEPLGHRPRLQAAHQVLWWAQNCLSSDVIAAAWHNHGGEWHRMETQPPDVVVVCLPKLPYWNCSCMGIWEKHCSANIQHTARSGITCMQSGSVFPCFSAVPSQNRSTHPGKFRACTPKVQTSMGCSNRKSRSETSGNLFSC